MPQTLKDLYRPIAEALVAGESVALDGHTAFRLRQLFGLEIEKVSPPAEPYRLSWANDRLSGAQGD